MMNPLERLRHLTNLLAKAISQGALFGMNNPNLTATKKTVNRKGKTFTQTFYTAKQKPEQPSLFDSFQPAPAPQKPAAPPTQQSLFDMPAPPPKTDRKKAPIIDAAKNFTYEDGKTDASIVDSLISDGHSRLEDRPQGSSTKSFLVGDGKEQALTPNQAKYARVKLEEKPKEEPKPVVKENLTTESSSEDPRDKHAVTFARLATTKTPEEAISKLVTLTKDDTDRAKEIIYLATEYLEQDGNKDAGKLREALNQALEDSAGPKGANYKDDAMKSYGVAGGRQRDKVDPKTQYIYASTLRPLGSWASKLRAGIDNKSLELVDTQEGTSRNAAHTYVFSDKPLENDTIESYELKHVANPTPTPQTKLQEATRKLEETAQAIAGPKIGDTKIEDGVTYKFNSNHRWERVEEEKPEPAGSNDLHLKLGEKIKELETQAKELRDTGEHIKAKKLEEFLGGLQSAKFRLRLKGNQHERDNTPETKQALEISIKEATEALKKEMPKDDEETPPARVQTEKERILKPVPEDLPIKISHDDVPYQLAYDAHRHSSFSPDTRAYQRQQEYVNTITQMHDELKKHAKSPEQEAALKEELQKFRDGYLDRYKSKLSSDSRTASTMITGGANFNVRRNQKRLDAAHNKLTDLLEYLETASKRAVKRVKDAAPQQAKDDEYTETLKKEAVRSMGIVAGIDKGEEGGYRPLFVSNIAGKLERAWKSGNQQAVRDTLLFIQEHQKKLPKPLFTTKNKIWKLLDAPIPEKKTGSEVVSEDGNHGATMTLNHTKNGVEIKFPAKPPQAVIDQLNSAGFRFSRFQNLWYAKQSPRTLAAAKSMVAEDKSETLAKAEAPKPKGVMACFCVEGKPLEELKKQIKLEEKDPHMTLAYMGKEYSDEALEKTKKILENIAFLTQPLKGQISGLARFSASATSEGKDVLVALVDLPALPTFRERLVKEIETTGLEVSRAHGFVPHITIKYLDPKEPTPDIRIKPIDITFENLELWIGEEHLKCPFSNSMGKLKRATRKLETLAKAMYA
jgi:hypothetical protein